MSQTVNVDVVDVVDNNDEEKLFSNSNIFDYDVNIAKMVIFKTVRLTQNNESKNDYHEFIQNQSNNNKVTQPIIFSKNVNDDNFNDFKKRYD